MTNVDLIKICDKAIKIAADVLGEEKKGPFDVETEHVLDHNTKKIYFWIGSFIKVTFDVDPKNAVEKMGKFGFYYDLPYDIEFCGSDENFNKITRGISILKNLN